MKILFICKERGTPHYTDNKYGLYNSASFVCDAISKKYECKIISVIDANCIDKEITIYKPDLVILEAIWVPPYKLVELTNIPRHKHIKWIVRIHSKATFLANEGIAFNWMNEYSKIPNVTLSANNKEFNNDLEDLGYDSVYLPNIYNIDYKIKRKVNLNKGIIKIGCFGALRPMKNQLAQAIAAIKFAEMLGKSLEFHINCSRKEQLGENVLKNLQKLFEHCDQHKLVTHDWLCHKDFCKLVAEMDIGMQVSLSESFNIVTADFVTIGIPVVTSNDISFVSQLFRSNNETDSMIAALWIARLGDYVNLQHMNYHRLQSHNRSSIKTWFKYLGHIKHR